MPTGEKELVWKPGLRGMVELEVEHGIWPVLAWCLAPEERVSKAIQDAAQIFAQESGRYAQFVFTWAIPKGVAEFAEVGGSDDCPDMTLVLAEWVPAGFVVLACGGETRIFEPFRAWKRTECSGGAV